MKIHLGTDHSGYETKEKLKLWLENLGHEIIDHGAHTFDLQDNYTDFIFPVARAVSEDTESRGIVIGGSGQGEAIAANRIKGVRAAVFYGPVLPKVAVDAEGRMSSDKYELVRLSRQHNNSNVLSIGARFVDYDELCEAITVWLEEPFSGVQRHIDRIKMIDEVA